MTDVVISSLPHQHEDSMSALEGAGLRNTAPAIEMVRNPAFSFPMKPLTPSVSNEPSEAPRRPTSMLLQPVPTLAAHKRTVSALPTFSFNAGDTSGRQDDTPPQTPDENTMNLGTTTAATRKGHRRGGSEFVGGDSRFGVNNAITSSPTKTDAPLLPEPGPSPAARRRHAHRRSVAVSSHDLSQIMSEADKSPRLSTSLPNSPSDMPPLAPAPVFARPTPPQDEEPRQPGADDSPVRPPSRPRVEFVEAVEIIPRPLSTISSETESSISTVIGHHSVSNSINSVLSLGSPPSAHARVPSVGLASVGSIAEPRTKQRSSVEISRRVEKEGEWLKARASTSEQSSPQESVHLTIDEPQVHKRQKRQSHSFGFDRRRSEPLISATASDFTRLSALSLQDAIMHETTTRPATSDPNFEKRSSGQKLKQWALSKLHRRHSRQVPIVEPIVAHPESAESLDVPGKVSLSRDVVAETDLDAVFGNSTESLSPRFGTSPTQRTFENPSPLLESSTSSIIDLDDAAMVDLDAALGPPRTAAFANMPHRRHMHSDRHSKASGASNFLHRRAESEPVLMAFNYNRVGSTPQKSMEDVFEEDEEDTQLGEEAGMGITMVDSDRSAFDPANPESLRLRRAARDSDRPSTSYTSSTSQLVEERPASLVDDIIIEEASPPEAVPAEIEIVEAHEEPRAASLEKSSDSSEASTLLGTSTLLLPEGGMSPSTYHSSSFSSPDFSRRQGSFEVPRGGTSASSIADTRTTSSCMTGEPGHEVRMSVDDVPSLTSSRSTMLSTMHADTSRRDVSESRVYEAVPRAVDPAQMAARRKKRASIQSLSQLVGGTFGSRSRMHDESRPQTATLTAQPQVAKKKEHRLKKLMFWRSKQNLRQAAADAEAAI